MNLPGHSPLFKAFCGDHGSEGLYWWRRRHSLDGAYMWHCLRCTWTGLPVTEIDSNTLCWGGAIFPVNALANFSSWLGIVSSLQEANKERSISFLALEWRSSWSSCLSSIASSFFWISLGAFTSSVRAFTPALISGRSPNLFSKTPNGALILPKYV